MLSSSPTSELWHKNTLTGLMLCWTVADLVYLLGLGSLQAGSHQSKADYAKYTPLNIIHSFFSHFRSEEWMQASTLHCVSEVLETGPPLKSNRKETWWCNCSLRYKSTTNTYWVRHMYAVKLPALRTESGKPQVDKGQNLTQNALPGGWKEGV